MTGDTLFWLCLGGLVYAYLGYPLLLACARPFAARAYAAGAQAPQVSVIVAAHNEADVIMDKIRNFLALDYPAERKQLIVISDGSSDGTDEIVQTFQDERIVLIRQEPQAGKSSALNRGVEAASGEVLVFTDANSMFSAEALRHLVAPFVDPRVGATSGVLQYEADEGSSGEGLYWRYEQEVKKLESAMGRLLGANGAIYAIRRELVPRLHPLDVNDFRVPYEALLRGRHVILASEATASERAAPSVGDEMARKVRIMSRALPMFFSLAVPTLARGRLFVAWELLSHKILREIQAVFFLGMLAGGVWGTAMGTGLGPWLLGLQVLGYGVGAAGWRWEGLRRARPVRAAAYLTMIAVASVWALARWVGGRNRAIWQRTDRTPT